MMSVEKVNQSLSEQQTLQRNIIHKRMANKEMMEVKLITISSAAATEHPT